MQTASSTLFPYTTLFRSSGIMRGQIVRKHFVSNISVSTCISRSALTSSKGEVVSAERLMQVLTEMFDTDRKSTRLNSSHRCISYAVLCLKKKISTEGYYR